MNNIAIIAHDSLKTSMVKFIVERENWIPDVSFLATGRTAEFLEEEGVEVMHLSPGQYGGYNQIIEKIDNKEIDIVIFFRDIEVTDHHEDINNLMNTCIKNNIPYAVNFASAELLILGLLRKETADKYIKKRTLK